MGSELRGDCASDGVLRRHIPNLGGVVFML